MKELREDCGSKNLCGSRRCVCMKEICVNEEDDC